MEHSCQRCGSPVDDSAPFCNSCGASQVRFPGPVATQPVRIAIPTSTGSPIQIEAAPPPTITLERNHARLERSSALRAVVAAGIIAGLLSVLPLGFIFGSPLGGFLSVLLYRRRSWSGDPSPRAGFRLGVLSGVVGYVTLVLLAGAEVVLRHGENEFRNAMIDAVHRQQARTPDPQARQMLDYFLTPHGFMVMMIVGLIFTGIVFVLLSGVGGTISAALLRRKEPPR